MSFDFQDLELITLTRQRISTIPKAHPKDLQALATLLEVAALSLTTSEKSNFTLEQLLEETRKFGGEDFAFEEEDLKVVLSESRFIRMDSGDRYYLP